MPLPTNKEAGESAELTRFLAGVGSCRESLETVSAGRSARDRAMRKHLESTFARFADEYAVSPFASIA